MIELAVLDMAGTTVRDGGMVDAAFDAAISAAGIERGTERHRRATEYVRDTMGMSKIDVFRALFPADESAARQANTEFEQRYAESMLERCSPIDGAESTLHALRERGIAICLSTGFSANTKTRLLHRLGWEQIADLALCPQDVRRGRPYPDMVLTAALRLGVSDVRNIAVVGDTGYDMLAGSRSGAGMVCGVLTGAHDERALRENGATHVLESVAELPGLLG